MKKNYVLGIGVLGMSILSSMTLTYATDEQLDTQDSSIVSHKFEKKEKKHEEKREKKAPKDFKELTEEEKAEFEAKKVEMQEKMKTEFQEKLSKGEISQEEYDTFIENLESGKGGCPMEGKRKMEIFKGENNEEKTEKGQFKMMKDMESIFYQFTENLGAPTCNMYGTSVNLGGDAF